MVRVAAGGTDLARLVCLRRRGAIDDDDVHALERAAAVAALLITRQEAITAVENKYRGDFLRDVFLGRAGEAELRRRARRDLRVGPATARWWWSPPRSTRRRARPSAPSDLRRRWQERFADAWRQVSAARDARHAQRRLLLRGGHPARGAGGLTDAPARGRRPATWCDARSPGWPVTGRRPAPVLRRRQPGREQRRGAARGLRPGAPGRGGRPAGPRQRFDHVVRPARHAPADRAGPRRPRAGRLRRATCSGPLAEDSHRGRPTCARPCRCCWTPTSTSPRRHGCSSSTTTRCATGSASSSGCSARSAIDPHLRLDVAVALQVLEIVG